MATPTSRRPRARGISTAEILAGTTVTLILAASLYTFAQSQLKALAAQGVYSESQNVTRTSIDFLARELRMASYDPTGLALAVSPGPICPGVRRGIVSATPTSIRFQQDLNGDGLLLGPGEDVTYALVAGELRRADGALGTQVTLAKGLGTDGLRFLYFDGSNPPVQLGPTGTPSQLTAEQRDCVAKIRMTVRAGFDNPHTRKPLVSMAASEVAIRSRSLMNF